MCAWIQWHWSDGTQDARKILAAVHLTGQFFGAAHIIDVLRGNETEKVLTNRHHNSAAFGAGATRKREEWQSLIRQLVGGGFLRIDIGGYGGLKITAKGRSVMGGEETFRYRPASPARKKEKHERVVSDVGLTGDETYLLEALKKLRLELAKQRQVPAYVIFSDRSLLDMACRSGRAMKHEVRQSARGGRDKAERFRRHVLEAHDPSASGWLKQNHRSGRARGHDSG